jgi:Na+/melibiose symporter-like transporter
MKIRLGGLWRHRDFVRLWSGQTISIFGSLTTRVALPFTAIIYLDARAFQVALITTSDVLAGICFALFAGVWVDRLRRRPIMIAADLGRAAIIGSVPIAAVAGVLRVEQLYAVAFLAGILTTFFDVAYQTYLPTLVDAGELVEGNSKLAASASVAEFGAFSFAGWLVQLVTAPGAMAVDAVSFLFSAASLKSIRRDEPAPAPIAERQSVRVEILEGLRAVARHEMLRPLAVSWIALSAASGVFGSLFVLYVTRDLGFSPGVQGVIYGVGGLTSFFGAVVADWCRRRFGAGGAMIVGMSLGGLGMILILGAPPSIVGLTAAVLVAQQIISDPGWTVYEINAVSLRQAIAPERLLGRVNAATRFSGLVAMLASSLVAGAIAGATSPRVALAAGACAMLAGALSLVLSPVRRVRDVTTIVEVEPSLA